jgi:acetyl esterase/lipase
MDDPLRDDNLAFASKLKEAGVEVDLLKSEGMPHSFFMEPEILKEADAANRAIAAFAVN